MSSSGLATHVYVRSETEKWAPARLVSIDSANAIVNHADGKQEIVSLSDYPNKVLPLQNVDAEGTLKEVEDMVHLPFLHEAAILYNLKARHYGGKPYTRTGDIVMAVNPYQWFHHLYTNEMRQLYSKQLVWGNDGDRNQMPPHVYEVSALSYKGLATDKMNQSILVSGESGAGKTETVKICLNHLAHVQAGPDHNIHKPSEIVQRIVDTNPLLEAFGNAKTSRNDNSSRFGKYIQLQFSKNNGQEAPMSLIGSCSQVYLLEKSRVVHHEKNERTFHIFYQLLASPDAVKTKFWKRLKGKTASSFSYVGESVTASIEGQTDDQHFSNTLNALTLVGIKGEKLQNLMAAMCAVLQLGNIGFKGCTDESRVSTPKALRDLADLMGVSAHVLTQAFTARTMTTKGETYKVPLNAELARDSCDALAKELYHKAFLWLVQQINIATKASTTCGDTSSFIGLLDIFGFESFQTNGFEQLCINYANEKLQQKFTEDIFREVQAEYEFEGIALHDIYYDDNTQVVNLIENPMGLLAMLNEECLRPKGSDREFVYKAISENHNSPALIMDSNKLNALEFGVRHYCADVIYNAAGFISKNNDGLVSDLMSCVLQSSNPIIASEESLESKAKRGSNLVASTIWTKYRDGLSNLMAELKQTQSRYIRCIKPNDSKQPSVMEHGNTLDQLRSAGVVAAITISRSAFPNRLGHFQLWDRFRCLFPKDVKRAPTTTQDGMIQNINTLMSSALKHLEGTQHGTVIQAFVIGKTRTYFRAGALEFLESERFKGKEPASVTMQAAARGFIVRRRKARQGSAVHNAAVTIQNLFRQKSAKLKLRQTKKGKKIESLRRMKAAREKRKINKAAAIVQAMVRGAQQRPKYRIALREQKEVGGIKEQIEYLKAKLESAEEERVAAVKDAEERVTHAMATMQDDEMGSAELQNINNRAKLDESEKVLDFLRRERKRLMGLVKTHKNRCERIVEQNQEFEESTNEVKKRMKEVENHKLVIENNRIILAKNKEIYVNQLKTYRKEIQTGHAYLQAEEGVRNCYQDAVERIVALVQEECRNDDLVEDIYLLAMECGDFGDAGADKDDDLGDLDDMDDSNFSDSEAESGECVVVCSRE